MNVVQTKQALADQCEAYLVRISHLETENYELIRKLEALQAERDSPKRIESILLGYGVFSVVMTAAGLGWWLLR